jgi:hypothetical protein
VTNFNESLKLLMSCINALNRPIGDIGLCSGVTASNPMLSIQGPLAGSDLSLYWCQNDCPNSYIDLLYRQPDTTFALNSANLVIVQDYVASLFTSYQQTNIITDSVNSVGYSTFQNTLLNLCLNTTAPGICDQALTDLCTPLGFTGVSKSPILSNFCGCYVTDPRYIPYNVPIPCLPLCHRTSTIQKANPATLQNFICQSNICVIDDATINLINSDTTITFQQLCPGCGATVPNSANPSICECIISGVNVTSTMQNAGLGTQFSQLCGSTGSLCLQDVNGTLTPIDCTKANPNAAGPPALPITSYVPVFWTIIVIVVFIFLILAIFTFKKSKPSVIVKDKGNVKSINTAPKFTQIASLPKLTGLSELNNNNYYGYTKEAIENLKKPHYSNGIFQPKSSLNFIY